jgi:signal transduction histidine kinase/DNA-binding LacI/PurR family transcriptional regulator/DNA-binding response OmpR family regulator
MSPNSAKRPTIGVLVGWQMYEGVLNSFLVPMFRGIYATAQSQDCNLLLACGHATDQAIRPAWPAISSETDFVPVGPWNTDGLIVINPLLSESRSRYVQKLITSGHPVVFVGAGEPGPAVVPDNSGGIRQAFAHLVEHGHRQIAFIAGHEEHAGDSHDRLEAFRAITQEYGWAADPNLISHGFHMTLGGEAAMKKILASGASFTAVLASNDACAIGAMRALRDAGRRIPQDVAVIGFDDLLEAKSLVPSLTTIRYPTFEIGYRALRELLDHLGKPHPQPTETICISTRLIIRQSCGCEPGGVMPAGPTVAPSRAPRERGRGMVEHRQAPDMESTPPGSVLTPGLTTHPRSLEEAMARSVLAESELLSANEVELLCRRIVEALTLSLAQDSPAPFQSVFEETLHQVEAAQDDPYAWQAAISVLVHERASLPGAAGREAQLENWLHWARIAINRSTRRQFSQYIIQQSWIGDETGLLGARLLAAIDEAEIFRILSEEVPSIGIRQVWVIFFEPEADDPVTWSVIRSHPASGRLRFATRRFPPPGLCPTDQPFRLALLPLALTEGRVGFVAFDAVDLGPCLAVVRQLTAALQSAQMHQLKNRFLSMVSHELRTPLNLIVGLSEMLLREQSPAKPVLPEAYREDVQQIHLSAQLLNGLIRDVLDLSRSEANQSKLTGKRLNLGEVLRPVTLMGKQLALDKGLEWQAQIPNEPLPVWGDATRLQQVALNLVSNAVKFTEKGKITLEVKRIDDLRLLIADWKNQQSTIPKGLSVSNQQSREHILVSISDTGLGIPPEEQRVIFDEFRQSERTTARGYGGLGLGLAICKRLVELHGGQIGVHSSGEEDAGSTFYFSLPILNQLATPLDPEARAQTIVLLKEARGRDRFAQLHEHLIEQGFQVEEVYLDEAGNWLTGLVTAPPAAVVLGLQLASERGWELLVMLKQNPATQAVPVLFCSMKPDGDTGALLELDYLTKPVGTTELAHALTRQGLLAEDEPDRLKTILIVDDEPGSLDMHARMVEAQSPAYRVIKAHGGREALEQMQQLHPNLVLLDLMMPDINGFGVLQAMRRGANTRDIPVIVLTAQVLTEEDMARLNDGVATVLGKGLFTTEETLSHIEAVLARQPKPVSEAQRLVRRTMAYIHWHYAEPVSRKGLADYVGVSEDYLTRCFRQEINLTPMAYLRRYRLNKAKELLTQTQKSVTAVALAVGFPDHKYFMQVFRRGVGVSPGAYRRGSKRKKAD